MEFPSQAKAFAHYQKFIEASYTQRKYHWLMCECCNVRTDIRTSNTCAEQVHSLLLRMTLSLCYLHARTCMYNLDDSLS